MMITSRHSFRPALSARCCLGLLFLSLPLLTVGCGSGDLDLSSNEVAGARLTSVLPNWATPEEEALAEMSGAPTTEKGDASPTGAVRLPAEYEPMRAVLVTWASFTDMLEVVAKNAAAAGAEVWAVGGPSRIEGVPAEKYTRLGFGYDSVWVRDYGPFGIDVDTQKLAIVDTTYRHYASRTSDDAIPCKVASTFGMACHSNELILDGGNLMSDGKGNLFLTKRIYDWNKHLSQARVDELLRDYFGAETLHLFDYAASYGQPADGTGHIDMFAKIVGECKVIVAKTDTEPFKTPLEKAASYFASLPCGEEGTYEVFRIPAWYESRTWYTYTNSLIVNDRVLVPEYADGDSEAARAVYTAARPDLAVVFVSSDDSIPLGGSVHCITKEIPVAPQPEDPSAEAEAPEAEPNAETPSGL